MVRTDEECRRGRGPVAGRFDQGGTRRRIAVSEVLRNNWLEIWYQPKIDLKRKCLAGAEALQARIRGPRLAFCCRVILSPTSTTTTLPSALLAPLLDWTMFEEAGFDPSLAINVPISVLLRSCRSRGWSRNIQAEFAALAGIDPGSQRGSGFARLALAEEIASQLRVSGISIAIDDFGARHSSFSSLRQLPFAELKIDRSFVGGCATNATNAAICRTAIDLAHRFGGFAVAQGSRADSGPPSAHGHGLRLRPGRGPAPPMPEQASSTCCAGAMSKPRAAAPNEAIKMAPKRIGRVA